MEDSDIDNDDIISKSNTSSARKRKELIQRTTGSVWSPTGTVRSHEEMVNAYVNTFHIPFSQALLLYKDDHSIKDKNIKHLNYSNQINRVNHLKEAWIQAAQKYAANFTAWQAKVKRDNGLEPYDELEKNLKKIELTNPTQLLTACMSAVLKIQKTFDYSQFETSVPFERLLDFIEASIAMGLDLDEFGMGSNIPSLIKDTMHSIKRPEFDLSIFDMKESKESDNMSNDTKKFTPDTSKPARKPVLHYYMNKRGHRGLQPQQTLHQKLFSNNIPDFGGKGECMLFNLHAEWSNLFPKCCISDANHLKTHFCTLCDNKKHGLMKCTFVRASLKPCAPLNDWRSKDYSNENVILYKPKDKDRKDNNSKRRKPRLTKREREILKKEREKEKKKEG